MGVSVTNYGNQKAIFANQDDGIFSAVPITFDESVLTLETYTANSRRFVKAGSVVKYGTTVKGITAEEYEITNGPINGRVVLEGYVYVERLTQAAAESMSLLPKIVPIPYGKVIFNIESGHGLDIIVRVSGSVWKSTVAAASFTVKEGTVASGMTIDTVVRDSDDNSLVKITFDNSDATGKGSLSITAVSADAVVGSAGKVVVGLPLVVEFKDGEVCIENA